MFFVCLLESVPVLLCVVGALFRLERFAKKKKSVHRELFDGSFFDSVFLTFSKIDRTT